MKIKNKPISIQLFTTEIKKQKEFVHTVKGVKKIFEDVNHYYINVNNIRYEFSCIDKAFSFLKLNGYIPTNFIFNDGNHKFNGKNRKIGRNFFLIKEGL